MSVCANQEGQTAHIQYLTVTQTINWSRARYPQSYNFQFANKTTNRYVPKQLSLSPTQTMQNFLEMCPQIIEHHCFSHMQKNLK